MTRNIFLLVLGFTGLFWPNDLAGTNPPDPYQVDLQYEQTALDTFPLDQSFEDFITGSNSNPFDIKPGVIEETVEYDPESGNYILTQKMGEEYFGAPTYLTFDEYVDWKAKKQQEDYFNKLSGLGDVNRSASGKIDPMSKIDIQSNLIDRLFGGTAVTIQPRGNIDLTFGVDYQKIDNPNIPPRVQQTGGFDFDMDIQMNVDGKIGEKMDLNFNYNTQATFDFDNKIKLAYNSENFSEDDIIKTIEMGDVSLPLRGQLIPGVQSLFGVKTSAQFGRLTLTGLAAQQRSQQNNLVIENGQLVQEFELTPDQYDENRHFFLTHYHRERYNDALSNLPQVKSVTRITNIEVWVTNDQNSDLQNSTRVVPIYDLAEPNIENFVDTMPMFEPNGIDTLPENGTSGLFAALATDDETRNLLNTSQNLQTKYGLEESDHFEIQSMRRLNSNEFTFHPELGIISLNIRLRTNQVLGVAFEYVFLKDGDTIYKVGEMSNEASSGGLDSEGNVEPDDVIYVKMLKGTNQRVDIPAWDLMMKNVYSIGGGQLNPDDFQFDIFYQDNSNASFTRFLPEEDPAISNQTLLEIFQLDQLNRLNDPQQDGIFDFIPGLTVNTQTGSIFFPVIEPFGESLRDLLGSDALFEIYNYSSLYDESVTDAREDLGQNRFILKGKYKSSTSSEYNLGAFNIPQGSVVVRAGSQTLTEGVDYDIDYGVGRLKIINQAYLQQGVPINISFENQNLFSLQQKTMFGLRADFAVNDNFNIGATYMRLFERPFTEKVNLGDDPINNRVFGLDINFSKESDFLTKAVDKLPFYSTKEKSSINFSAEVAAIKPGHSGAINLNSDEDDNGGVVSIDDFEGASSAISLGTQPNLWLLSSTPQSTLRDPSLPDSTLRFPESTRIKDVAYGFNRAKLNWYVIDDRRVRNDEDRADSYTRIVDQSELFNRDLDISVLPDLLTFDLNYCPDERGPYNFVPPDGYFEDGLMIEGINEDRSTEQNCLILDAPEERWGGITRYLQNNDFQASNFEYIEFWMLNPFLDRRDGTGHENEEGSMFFNLGNVSEDILKDGLQFFENALPTPADSTNQIPLVETEWARVPLTTPQVNGFNRENQESQDLGLDGLNDIDERVQQSAYVEEMIQAVGPLNCFIQDPANDNFVTFTDNRFTDSNTLFDRYAAFNNTQGNALTENSNQQFGFGRGNPIPDQEDLNGNRSLDVSENFYEYEIKLRNTNGEIERSDDDFITDEVSVNNPTTGVSEKWYRFQIPIKSESAFTKVGNIDGFRSVQFIRMFMTGFRTQKTFRLAEFELARNQWRRLPVVCGEGTDPIDAPLIVDQVGIEENSNKQPFRYVSPRGIQQQRLFNTFNNVLQDERSLKLNTCELNTPECLARVYKLTEIDIRLFKRLQMFVHAEKTLNQELEDGDMSVFLRLGKDFDNNYYEYELPLTFSNPDSALVNDNRPEEYAAEVWREENKFDFALDEFLDIKRRVNLDSTDMDLRRIMFMNQPDLFEVAGEKPGSVVRMKGNPSLGFIRSIQLGVRRSNGDMIDDGCAEIWFNELRMSGLEEDGGVAGLARLELQLADLGDVTMSGQYSSVGWGAIDQKLIERNQERLLDYDVATNLNLGKFLPEKWNVRVPFYYQYARSIVDHKWDQYELDLTQAELLDNPNLTEVERLDIRERSKEKTTIQTVNFTNVRKERGQGSKGEAKPWDIENVSVSYSHTKTNFQDVFIEDEEIDDKRASIDYSYSRKAKYIQPFKKIKNKSLKIIKEINFNPLPNSFSFNTEMNRFKSVKKYRLPSDIDFVFNDQVWDWSRNYDLRWDFTKALKASFSATNYSAIDELKQVGVRPNAADREYKDEKGRLVDPETGENYTTSANNDPGFVSSYARSNIRDGGRTKNYNHSLSVDYNLPIRYLPFMDWTSIKASYDADYGWTAGSLQTIDALGNVIHNNQSRSLNATFSFDKLYSKFKYFKSLDRKPSRRRSTSRSGNLKKEGEAAAEAATDSRVKEKKVGPGFIEKLLVRPLLSLRNVKFSYNENQSTVIPGFTREAKLLGLASGFAQPGFGFAFGLQPDISNDNNNNFLRNLERDGVISNDEFQNRQVIQNNTQSYALKVALEPWRDVKIDVNFDKTFRKDHSENFYAGGTDIFNQVGLIDVGSFDVSFISLNTLFESDKNKLIDDFKQNRSIFSTRLASLALDNRGHDIDSLGAFERGFGPLHNDVMTFAFLAAYTGANPVDYFVGEGSTTPQFPTSLPEQVGKRSYIPAPNWNLKYNGLSKLPMFQNMFSSVSIRHGYKSNLRVNQFKSDLEFVEDVPGLQRFIDPEKPNLDYFSRFEVPTIEISEQFAPLIGIDLKTRQNLNLNFEYAKARDLSLQTGIIQQLVERSSTELIFGFGWVIPNVNIGFLTGDKGKGRKKPGTRTGQNQTNQTPSPGNRGVSNNRGRELTLNADFSFRDDRTLIYELNFDIEGQDSRGARTWTFNPSIDYTVNENFTLSYFVDFSRTVPYLNTSFPITTFYSGVTARFTLN